MTKPTQWLCDQRRLILIRVFRPFWSESSLQAQWVAKDPRFLHANSEDWSDWAGAQSGPSLRWAHMPLCWFCHEAAHFTLYLSYLTPKTTCKKLVMPFINMVVLSNVVSSRLSLEPQAASATSRGQIREPAIDRRVCWIGNNVQTDVETEIKTQDYNLGTKKNA